MAHELADDRGLTTETTASPRLSTFHSLRYSDFRYLIEGQIGAAGSMWMENLARPLLILELTDSALMLGLLTATRTVPQLLVGVWAGVLADRADKRQILLISQAITLMCHLTTALLIFTGWIEVWQVFALTFVTGSMMAFNAPARQSLVPRLVPDDSLQNAVALNLGAMNLMRIGGPSLAGLILAFFDLGDLYLVQGLIYFWVMFSTWRIKMRTREPIREHSTMTSEFVEGFSAVKRDPVIFYLLLLCLGLFVLGFPYQGVFIPLIAVKELDIGRSGAGLLISVTGIGALIGSLFVATYGSSVPKRGMVMLAMVLVFGVGLILFARTDMLIVVIPALILTGSMQTAFISLNNSYVLQRTPPELHGRVMSLFSLDRGLIPLGSSLAGFLAEELGPQQGLTVMACLCITATLIVAFTVPALRRIR